MLPYDANGSIAVITPQIYYQNKDEFNYPLLRVTLFEEGCQQPTTQDANLYLSVEGNAIHVQQDAVAGYKLGVCIKFEFTQRLADQGGGSTSSTASTSASASATTTTGASSSAAQAGPVVYELT